MTTLIRSGSGDSSHSCDARCYGAHGAECDCICGGMNHGKGEAAAIENTRSMARELVQGIEARGGWIAEEVRQAVLL